MSEPSSPNEHRPAVAVIDYGVNNVGSVVNALKRVGAAPHVAKSGADLASATAMVLPGIGAFDTGVRNLHDLGLYDAIKARVADGVPILGICLGMQLLSRGSEEGSLEGLSLIDAQTHRFSFDKAVHDLKVPHMGWHDTQCTDDALFDGLLGADTRFYYVHSFHVVCNDAADVAATCNYGSRFVSAVRRGQVFGTQFHPEKSHRFGLRVFANYVRQLATNS
jgi:glutamine amidotransferase